MRLAKRSTLNSSSFWAVAYSYFILVAGTNVPGPLYHSYEKLFGFSPLTLTLIYATYAATLIPALLLAGPLSDAVGRRTVILPALIVAVIGSVLFAAARGTPWLYIARGAQGLAVGAASGALVALLSELEPKGDQHRSSLVATLAPVSGIAAGALFSGFGAQYLPSPRVTPFVVEIGLLMVAVCVCATVPDASVRQSWTPRRPTVPADIRAIFYVSSMSSFLGWAVAGLFLSLIPSYLAVLAGIDTVAVSGAVMAFMLAASSCAQYLVHGKPPLPLQLVGAACLLIGLIVLIVVSSGGTIWLLFATPWIIGIGHGLTFFGAMGAVNDVAPRERHADIVSSFLVATYLGSSAPIIGTGLLITQTGLVAAVGYFAMIIALVLAIVFALLLRLWAHTRTEGQTVLNPPRP